MRVRVLKNARRSALRNRFVMASHPPPRRRSVRRLAGTKHTSVGSPAQKSKAATNEQTNEQTITTKTR